jgi:formylglycine-generating enzyme required for sulfatase activity
VNYYPDGVSPFGAFNMAGSVWEWVEDDYAANYTDAAADGSAYLNNSNDFNGEKVLRGGGWTSPSEALKTSTRQNAAPIWNNINNDWEYSTIGFRCAYDVHSR